MAITIIYALKELLHISRKQMLASFHSIGHKRHFQLFKLKFFLEKNEGTMNYAITTQKFAFNCLNSKVKKKTGKQKKKKMPNKKAVSF